MRGPRTLAGRLFLGVGVSVVALLAVLGMVLDRILEADLVSALTERLEAQARTVAVALPPGVTGLQADVSRLGGAGGVRITVIRADGVVLADSERDPATLENHRDRPEVREALAGRVGVAVRRSESTGEEYRYVALPVR
ncbi:MAG TPA: histidine kinase, partial [Actinomycetota bacterium]|nr:histidine kinase [Actinomycetota bacterium]